MARRMSRFDRACEQIVSDLESSKRHWTEVLENAKVRLASWPERTHKSHQRDIDVATWKLAQLAAGTKVSMMMNTEG